MGREARAKKQQPLPPAAVALSAADLALLLDALGEYIESTLPAIARQVKAPGLAEQLVVLRGRAMVLRGTIAAAAQAAQAGAPRPEAPPTQRSNAIA